jgi:SsrA-binding protein
VPNYDYNAVRQCQAMLILNKKAKYNYNLFETVEAGISLLGGEVKSLRDRGADLSESYVKFLDGNPYLVNASIQIPGKKDYTATRSRKLLLHKKEILALITKAKAKKLTLVPIKMYTKGRLVKLEIALAKAKREFEKRETIKKKDADREIEQELKSVR